VYDLACEGRFICIAPEEQAQKVVLQLQEFNNEAAIIGEIVDDKSHNVIIQTILGKRILPKPSGNIVPRIC